jgi:glutamate-1-semialdehyde 2,1-aminomutase
MDRNAAFFERAQKVLPFGVGSNFRYWGDGEDIGVARAEGAHIWDMDGNRYIDYRLGFGPVILGHGHPVVADRVAEAIRSGTVFALTHELEVKVAERIVTMCPGVDQVRFANSGTEATMHALRIARSHTGREKIIKFEGTYHGMYDYMLFSTVLSPLSALGHRRSPIPAPTSSGIPKAIHELVITLPYNDPETLERTVKQTWGDVAAVIVEPILGNMAGKMPQPGWLAQIRSVCDAHGIVMIVDEVKTGFRIAPGGAHEYFGVHGDLVTYAKSIGNGYPIAAIGGSSEVMSSVGPGRTAHGGTYCGNVVGTAAADATLEIIAQGDALKTIEARGEALMAGIGEILSDAGLAHHVVGHPSMFGIIFSEEEPADFRAWLKTDHEMYTSIISALIDRGAMRRDARSRRGRALVPVRRVVGAGRGRHPAGICRGRPGGQNLTGFHRPVRLSYPEGGAMRVLSLGGAGAVCQHATRDLAEFSSFDEIVIGDYDVSAAQRLAAEIEDSREIGDPRLEVLRVDAEDYGSLVEIFRDFDVVLNGLPWKYDMAVTQACVEAGTSGLDVSTEEEQWDYDLKARKMGIVFIPGMGATPGITNAMARRGADLLDSVDDIRINFAAFRCPAPSPGLLTTFLWEFHPETDERLYYKDGEFHRTAPFAGTKWVTFPGPIGEQEVCYIPHPEVRTMPGSLEAKAVSVRGCFPPHAMRLAKAMLESGLYSEAPIVVKGAETTAYEMMYEILLALPESKETPLWAYGLLVEVHGQQNGRGAKVTLWNRHPPQEAWGGSAAYYRNIAIPLSIGVQMIARGDVTSTGVVPPETAIDPGIFFAELARRGIEIHEKIEFGEEVP